MSPIHFEKEFAPRNSSREGPTHVEYVGLANELLVLTDRADVIITPHAAWSSDLRSERVWVLIQENLRRYASGEAMLSVADTSRGY